jgi:two-component system nitrate/nitrite response regulator NarL
VNHSRERARRRLDAGLPAPDHRFMSAALAQAYTTPVHDASPRVRVLLADDHPLFRDGLARAITSHLGLELVAEAEDGLRALALVEELEPDVALLDVRMPRLDGLQVCARLAARSPAPRTRVVLVSAYVEPGLVARAVRAWACGYLGKDVGREEICDALIEAASGRAVFAAAAADGVVLSLEELFARPSAPARKRA